MRRESATLWTARRDCRGLSAPGNEEVVSDGATDCPACLGKEERVTLAGEWDRGVSETEWCASFNGVVP